MGFPVFIDTISIGLPIVYFKGSQVEFSILECISVSKSSNLILANSEILMKCNIMLHFIWVIIVCQSTHFNRFPEYKGLEA